MTGARCFVCLTCTEEYSAAMRRLLLTCVPPCPCCGSREIEYLGEGGSELPPDQADAA